MDVYVYPKIKLSYSGLLIEIGVQAGTATTNMSESINAVIKRF
jgi:hypothetical protein